MWWFATFESNLAFFIFRYQEKGSIDRCQRADGWTSGRLMPHSCTIQTKLKIIIIQIKTMFKNKTTKNNKHTNKNKDTKWKWKKKKTKQNNRKKKKRNINNKRWSRNMVVSHLSAKNLALIRLPDTEKTGFMSKSDRWKDGQIATQTRPLVRLRVKTNLLPQRLGAEVEQQWQHSSKYIIMHD